jgi:hypothetical protein
VRDAGERLIAKAMGTFKIQKLTPERADMQK